MTLFPWIKTYLRMKLLIKLGRLMHPKRLFLIHHVIGHIFIVPPKEDRQKFRVSIVKIIDYHETKLTQDQVHTHFVGSVNDDQYEDNMSYNYIINRIAKKEDDGIVWKFKYIVAHERPLIASYLNNKQFL